MAKTSLHTHTAVGAYLALARLSCYFTCTKRIFSNK